MGAILYVLEELFCLVTGVSARYYPYMHHNKLPKKAKKQKHSVSQLLITPLHEKLKKPVFHVHLKIYSSFALLFLTILRIPKQETIIQQTSIKTPPRSPISNSYVIDMRIKIAPTRFAL